MADTAPVPIREYVADLTAVMILAGGIYMAVTQPTVTMPQYFSTLFGVAGMYLFGKYTPNSA